MSEIGGYLSISPGNDNIGFVSPFQGYHNDASVLVGSAGADKFCISVSSNMNPIQIHDFNPTEGDKIELSPSYAIYDGFSGLDIVNGELALEFTYNLASEFEPKIFGGATKLSDNGRFIVSTKDGSDNDGSLAHGITNSVALIDTSSPDKSSLFVQPFSRATFEKVEILIY